MWSPKSHAFAVLAALTALPTSVTATTFTTTPLMNDATIATGSHHWRCLSISKVPGRRAGGRPRGYSRPFKRPFFLCPR